MNILNILLPNLILKKNMFFIYDIFLHKKSIKLESLFIYTIFTIFCTSESVDRQLYILFFYSLCKNVKETYHVTLCKKIIWAFYHHE